MAHPFISRRNDRDVLRRRSAFTLVEEVNAFFYKGGRDLSGFVDGWSNLSGWHLAAWLIHFAGFLTFRDPPGSDPTASRS